MRRLAAMLLAAGLAGASAQAQTVYRCGPDGRSYSQSPCPGGSAMDASDRRDADQREAAHAVASADRALADRMEHERLQRESVVPARAGSLGSRPVALKPDVASAKGKPTDKKKRKRVQESDKEFRATAPNRKGNVKPRG